MRSWPVRNLRSAMAPGSFLSRVLQYLANEVIVKGLANNPSFQRFAVRSAEQARALTKSVHETVQETAKTIAEQRNVNEISQVRKTACYSYSTFALIELASD